MAQLLHTTHSAPAATPKPSLPYVVQIVPPAEIEREALAMENLLQSFSLQEPFSLEICGEPQQQRFLLRASSEQGLRTLCQQVLAQYPQARLRRLSVRSDPLLLRDGEQALIGDFTLRAPTWLPIKTFWNEEMTQIGTDPVVGLLSAMEPVSKGERIISQLSLISAPDTWMQNYRRKAIETPLDRERQDRQILQSLQQSSAPDDSVWQEARIYIPIIAAIAIGVQGYSWYSSHMWQPLALLIAAVLFAVGLFVWWKLRRDNTLYDTKLVAEKLLRVAFYTQVRVIVIGNRASTRQRLQSHLNRLEVAYRQYNLANSNGFQLKQVRLVSAGTEPALALVHPQRNLPYHHPVSRLIHRGWSNIVLNAREVSGMWHLLQQEAEVPLVERLTTKRILAQPELFQRIRRSAKTFAPVLVGYSEHRGHSVPIYLPEETLFSHKFVIAKSGYGKSTLMQLLLRGAMMPVLSPQRLQPGVVAIDPHGDLIDDLLRQVPPERAQDIILIDLSDTERPPGINLLDATMGFTCDQAVANMMASFARIWGDSWGPRLAYVLKHVLRSLYTVNEQLVAQGKNTEQYTLLDVNPMLQQPKYARKILSILDQNNIQHQKELSFWNDYFFKLPPSFQQEVISPVSNKIGIFSDNHVLEHIVGQPITRINVNASVTDGKIILVNLASGRLEFDASAIIGATILNLVHRMLQLQAFIPFPERRQVFIAVDEFQNIPGADYEAYLSEDRKYGASIMLATQSLIRLEQMKEGLEAMTFSNCAQLFAFATSAEDAEKLEKELHEQVTVPHILNQPRLNCYARLALPDQPVQIFSLKLATPHGWKRTPENEAQVAAIRASQRERYLAREEVDQILVAQTKRYLNMPAQPADKADPKQEAKKPQSPPAAQTKGQNKPAQENKPKEKGAQPAQENKPKEKGAQPAQENKPKDKGAQPAAAQPVQENKPKDKAAQSAQESRPKEKGAQPAQENKPKDKSGKPIQEHKSDDKSEESGRTIPEQATPPAPQQGARQLSVEGKQKTQHEASEPDITVVQDMPMQHDQPADAALAAQVNAVRENVPTSSVAQIVTAEETIQASSPDNGAQAARQEQAQMTRPLPMLKETSARAPHMLAKIAPDVGAEEAATTADSRSPGDKGRPPASSPPSSAAPAPTSMHSTVGTTPPDLISPPGAVAGDGEEYIDDDEECEDKQSESATPATTGMMVDQQGQQQPKRKKRNRPHSKRKKRPNAEAAASNQAGNAPAASQVST